MRRIESPSADAATVLHYVSKQKFRMCQDIAQSEIQAGLRLDGERLRSALSECVRSGWLLRTGSPKQDPAYSLELDGGPHLNWREVH